MSWAPRVKPWHIRRLYKLTQIGIYDEDLLMEVGWGLYARACDAMIFHRAYGGRVPCPQCQKIVHRSKYHRGHKALEERGEIHSYFPCPACGQKTYWGACATVLRNHPKCYYCWVSLDLDYSTNTLSCPQCGKEWIWKLYQRSLKKQPRLPCPHCGEIINRQKRNQPKSEAVFEDEDFWGKVECPECGGPGVHVEGKYRCAQCGFERPWRIFVRYLKRQVEHLLCEECGHKFTWQNWVRDHSEPHIDIGNPSVVEKFMFGWIKAKTPQTQIIQIDNLLHALHGRGALAPVFISGNTETATQLLNELASI